MVRLSRTGQVLNGSGRCCTMFLHLPAASGTGPGSS